MIRFGIGILGLIAVTSAADTVSLVWIVMAALPFIGLMLWALPDIAE
jgi:hypothetical protein